MPKILISYRRADSDAIAGRIRDRLAGFYGEDSVFMDIDDIPFGIDFRKHIRDALLRNDVLIVVVGPHWLGATKGNPARIQDETDPVRVEVEIALTRGIPVIPLLVQGASMPRASDLPDALKEFAYRNAAPVDTGRDFHQHMDRLIRSVDRILADKKSDAAPGTVAEPIKVTPVPETTSAPTVPPADEQSSTARRRGPTKPKRAAGEGDMPAVTGPSIAAELPPTLAPTRPTSLAGAPPEPPAHGGRTAAPQGPETTKGAMGTIPGGKPTTDKTVSADDESQGTPAAKISVLRSWYSLLPTAAACAAVIVAVWVTYVLIPGTDRIQPREQTKEQTKEQPKELPKEQTKEPTKEQTKEQPPKTFQPAELAALACRPDAAGAFRDDFKSPRQGWDWGPPLRDSKASYADGQLVLWAPEKGSIGVLYAPLALKSGAVCAHVRAPHDDRTLATTGAGVIFWAQDIANYYVAAVHPDGSYGIYRYAGASFSVVSARTRFDSVKRGLGAVNEVAIAVDSNRGTLFINDVKVRDFEGQPPSGGNAVGLWMQAQEDQPNEWRFLDVAVVENR